MTRYKLLNGEKIKFTAKEKAKRDQEESQALIYKENQEQAIKNEETKKASGKQKLLDLGLTEEEVKALIGI